MGNKKTDSPGSVDFLIIIIIIVIIIIKFTFT